MKNEEGRNRGLQKPQPIMERTKQFALRIVRLYGALPKSTEAQVIGKQVLRSGTSVGAQCREGHRSRSKAEFISKMNGALMELEETMYWLELLTEADIVPSARLSDLQHEAGELTAIIVTIINNAKKGRSKSVE
jgi:four helix bundle protein